jgi:hypothetical protein
MVPVWRAAGALLVALPLLSAAAAPEKPAERPTKTPAAEKAEKAPAADKSSKSPAAIYDALKYRFIGPPGIA